MLSKKIRVPGKLMLSGEYAVLFGEEALAFTVDRFLEALVYESQDDKFHIESDIWPEAIKLSALSPPPPKWRLTPLIQALFQAQKIFLNRPLHIKITSDLDLTGGMGSSSAVILAACMASYLFRKKTELDPWQVPKLAYSIQKVLQNSASGYDILTQWLGGLVRMKPDKEWPGLWHRETVLPSTLHSFIHPYAGGKGAPTSLVMNATLAWLAEGERKKQLLDLSSQLTKSFTKFLIKLSAENFSDLLLKNYQHRLFFSSAPHFPHNIVNELEKLPACDKKWTFKTSGAGGEDAIILIGSKREIQVAEQCLAAKAWYPLKYEIYEHGLTFYDSSTQDFI